MGGATSARLILAHVPVLALPLSFIAGAILYQLLLAVVVRYSFLPAYTFKLVAAVLIACTIGMSQIKKSPQNDEL